VLVETDNIINSFADNDLLSKFIQVNIYQDIKYFNKERIELVLK
jgi:hypothetical protein